MRDDVDATSMTTTSVIQARRPRLSKRGSACGLRSGAPPPHTKTFRCRRRPRLSAATAEGRGAVPSMALRPLPPPPHLRHLCQRTRVAGSPLHDQHLFFEPWLRGSRRPSEAKTLSLGEVKSIVTHQQTLNDVLHSFPRYLETTENVAERVGLQLQLRTFKLGRPITMCHIFIVYVQ